MCQHFFMAQNALKLRLWYRLASNAYSFFCLSLTNATITIMSQLDWLGHRLSLESHNYVERMTGKN